LSRTDGNRAWSILDLQYNADEKAFFFASTSIAIGNGHTASFWENRWINDKFVCELAPQLYACITKRRRKIRMVAEGLADHLWARDIHDTLGVHEVGQYIMLRQAIEHT
jgi:hypothetical protein